MSISIPITYQLNNILNTLVPSHSLVGKSTIDNSQPTPGYLYVELQNETLKSNEKSQQILSQLLNRLKKDSPFIKLKALKCIKHILIKGSVNFRQDLLICSDHIHQCSNFRGKFDELQGDSHNAAVRNEANEILNLLFQFTNNSNNKVDIIDNQIIEGLGNSLILYDDQQQQQPTWVGFGSNGSITNTPLPPSTKIDQVKDKIIVVKDKIISHLDSNNNKKVNLQNFGFPILESTTSSFSQPSVPIRDGTHLMSQHHQTTNSTSNDNQENNEIFDSLYCNEEWYQLISNIIDSNTTSTISTTNISKFLQILQQQNNVSNILQMLDIRLQNKHWQIRQKSILLIESIFRNHQQLAPEQQQQIINYFKQNNNSLLAQTNSVQKIIRDKSRIILKQLNINIPENYNNINNINNNNNELNNNNLNNNNTNRDSHSKSSKTNQTYNLIDIDFHENILDKGKYQPVQSSTTLFSGLSVTNSQANHTSSSYDELSFLDSPIPNYPKTGNILPDPLTLDLEKTLDPITSTNNKTTSTLNNTILFPSKK